MTQGYVVSPTLFNVVVNRVCWCMVEREDHIWDTGETVMNKFYVDDFLICSMIWIAVRELMEIVIKEFVKFFRKENAKKTKVIMVDPEGRFHTRPL